MEKNRNITFDVAKGIGIVLVVIGHYIPECAPVWYIDCMRFVYRFHMPLFFIIAGFFFDRSVKQVSYGALVWSKFKRLMVPYFILSWAVIGIKIVFAGFLQVDHPVSVAALYRAFYLPEAGYYLWFVYVLFLIFCIAPIFKAGNRLILLTVLALGLSFWLSVPDIFCILQFFHYFIFFFFFMWVSRVKQLESAMYKYPLLWAAITVLFFFLYPPQPGGTLPAFPTIVSGISGSFMVISTSYVICRSIPSKTKGLSYIGRLSMTIYLFHTLFMGGGKAILTYINLGGDIIEFILSSLFIIGAGIVGPILLYKWVWAKNQFTAQIFK